LAWWLPGHGPYWGHNAIIRSQAFGSSGSLPVLSGRPPLGGEILSHDLVEAALLRRAGWSVWLLPEMEGSWEGLPPTITEHAARDRRWCQGNLQHLRLLAWPGLDWLSRLQLCGGAMAYLNSPIWLLLLSLGTFEAARTGFADAGWSADGLAGLLVATVALLLLPRLLALLLVLLSSTRRREFGGSGPVLRGVLAEAAFAAMLAPVRMLQHCGWVLSLLAGRNLSWLAAQRFGRGEGWSTAVRRYGVISLIGAAAGLIALFVAPSWLLWLSPALASLVAAVPVAALSGRSGLPARQRGWFLTPEETAPPPELTFVEPAEAAPGPKGMAVTGMEQPAGI